MNYKELSLKSRDLNNERKFNEAIEVLDSIKEEGKEDPSWYYRYAYSLTYTNQFKKAIDMLEVGITKAKDNYPFVYLLLGELYYWQGKLVDAFKMMEEGLKKCKLYEEESVWEFEQSLKDMYLEYPFANKEDWRYSILSNEFPDYDENADSQYKVKDIKKEKEKLAVYFGDYDREKVSFCVNINARLQPKHRFNIEDDLSYEFAINRLAALSGGGTLLDKDKRPCACDISFDVYADVEDYKNKFLDILQKNTYFPKGSYVDIFYNNDEEEVEKIDIGKYEVLAIGLDSQNLPEETYEKYNIGEILEKINLEFEEQDKFLEYFFYDETSDRFWLRFLGNSFEEMEKIIKKAVGSHPLCENAIIIDETYLNEKLEEEPNILN